MDYMDRISRLFLPVVLVGAVFFAGCGADPAPSDGSDTDSTATEGVAPPQTGLPSPIKMAMLILNADAPYNDELLNPQAKAETYPSAFKQALNLGVYQADLGYIVAHHQTQEALDYFQAVKKLGDKLGIIGAFEQGMMERAEKNLGSKDSLMDISSDAFADAARYLDANRRPEASGLIVVGGWVESTYIATQTLKTSDNTMLRRRVGQDKLILPRIIALIDAHNATPEYKDLSAKLHDLETAYANVQIKVDYKPATTDESKKMTQIGSKTKVRYKQADLDLITEKIAALRNAFIQ
jgi:hypothetical protein